MRATLVRVGRVPRQHRVTCPHLDDLTVAMEALAGGFLLTIVYDIGGFGAVAGGARA